MVLEAQVEVVGTTLLNHPLQNCGLVEQVEGVKHVEEGGELGLVVVVNHV